MTLSPQDTWASFRMASAVPKRKVPSSGHGRSYSPRVRTTCNGTVHSTSSYQAWHSTPGQRGDSQTRDSAPLSPGELCLLGPMACRRTV